MGITRAIAMAVVLSLAAETSWADFKYTEQSKVTGGALASMTKTIGVFSKSARQTTEPQNSVVMVKGNRMRRENAQGTIEIIDLDGRRFIRINPATKVYSVITFDQMKQQIQQAREKAEEEQTKAAAKHDDAQSVTLVPKVNVQGTGATRVVLDRPAKEMKIRVDVLFTSTDPKTEANLEKSNASYWITADSWYAPVSGYDEVRNFYTQMAKELDWLPGQTAMGNPQMGQAMEEFRKNSVKIDGMPLLTYSSMGMAGQGQQQSGQAASGQSSEQPSQNSESSAANQPTSARDAISKGLGGLFGKKKQQPSDNSGGSSGSSASATSANPAAPPPTPGSMMDVMTEVTSVSTDSLDRSLFDVPAGYTQVQPEAKDTP